MAPVEASTPAEEELAGRSEWLHITLSSIGDGVIATDAAGCVTFMNRVAEALTGWRMAEALGRPLPAVFYIVHEATRQVAENPALRALREGAAVEIASQTVLISRDGRETPIDDSASPMRSEAGALLGAVLVFRDVTERRQSEVERARLAEHLQLALAAAELGTWEWDPLTDHIVLSPRAAALYGVEPGLHLREALRGRLSPEHRERARSDAARAVSERSDYNIEYRIALPDQRVRWVAARGRGEYNAAGALTRMLGVVQDITARKEAELTLRESEARHRFLAELAAATQPLTAPEEVMAVSARLLAEHLNADRCAYAEVEAESLFVITGDYTRGVHSIVGRWPVAAFGAEFNRLMLANRPYVVDDADADARISGADLETYRLVAVQAVICVPLHKDGRFTAALAVHQRTARRWTPAEIDLVLSVAGRCWEALERSRVSRSLQRSEARYRAIVETTPECVMVVGPDGALLQMNKAGLALIETTEAALGRPFYKLVASEHQDAFRRFNERVCRGEEGSLEFDLIGLLGTRRHIEASAVPLQTESGWLAQLIVGRDVTVRHAAAVERERLHAEAEAERRRLEEVFQLAPSFMAVLRGPRHVFERANERYAALVGQRDLIGRSVREALPEIEGQGFFEILDRVYQTGESFSVSDARVLLQRGPGALQEALLEFVYQPLRDPDGGVSGVIVQGIDLTERRRAEARLARVTAESERRKRLYEAALSNTPDLVYVFDLEHRFTYANEALLRMWGRSWEEAIGKTCLELGYEPWHAAMHDREIDQVVATRRSIRGEVPFTGTNGRRIYDYIFVPVFGAEGEVEAVTGTTRDITDRKAMEQELQAADRRKDEFIALLAHELRNPLAPLRNGLQIIRLAPDRDRRDRARGMMERQLAHMVRLIDDLLDVSRVSRNKMELRRGRVSLAEVISSAVETTRWAIEEAGHELTVALPTTPVLLDADLTRLAQVFGNLLTNSAKYTPRGGRIWVEAERRDGEVQVSVTDTGIGIPAEALPRIFDMFSQVDRESRSGSAVVDRESRSGSAVVGRESRSGSAAVSRSHERASGGLGIGLALVRGLVSMHGGAVTATSAGPGRGSRFTVALPTLADRSDLPMATALEPEVDVWPGRRILVADDNQDGADSMAMMLRLLGNEVETAYDGAEAAAAAERFRPEVILVDVGMPKLGGHELTRLLRARDWARSVIIFALTGWGQEGDRERSREAGCDGHLVKPVYLPELMQQIEAVLAKR